MTVENIAHMEWAVKVLSSGEQMYTNTTGGITGVAVIGESGKFSQVIVVEDETSPRYVYDNTENSDWNRPSLWSILGSLAESIYDVEQDMIEESYDDLYDYEDHDLEDYDYGYECDSDLYNEQ